MEISQNIKLAVDAIVFGYDQNKLNILLIRQKFGLLKGSWALPGGFVQDDEGISDAVYRELREEAGVKISYLEQLYTFGDDVNRDPRFRVVAVAYFALVNSTRIIPKADSDADEARWFPVQELPEMAFDHRQMIETAYRRLKGKLMYQPVGFDLLPEEFAFSELEQLYACILEKEIDRRNFRKKILSFGLLEQTSQAGSGLKGRPAQLYKFNKLKYNKLERTGFLFEV